MKTEDVKGKTTDDWTGSLIDRLNEFVRDNRGEFGEVSNGLEASRLIQQIHGRFNEMKDDLRHPASAWIDVKEKLPEENKMVWAWQEGGANAFRAYWQREEIAEGQNVVWYDGTDCDVHFVTHWQPLPPPPK